MIRRYLISVETKSECLLLGVWGFSDKHVERKLQRLNRYGIYYDSGFDIFRRVDRFPEYVRVI